MRLPRIIGAHFSWTIEVTFPLLGPLTGHRNVFPFAINVNNVYPAKYKGKPN
jgi:hypothetical protein